MWFLWMEIKSPSSSCQLEEKLPGRNFPQQWTVWHKSSALVVRAECITSFHFILLTFLLSHTVSSKTKCPSASISNAPVWNVNSIQLFPSIILQVCVKIKNLKSHQNVPEKSLKYLMRKSTTTWFCMYNLQTSWNVLLLVSVSLWPSTKYLIFFSRI